MQFVRMTLARGIGRGRLLVALLIGVVLLAGATACSDTAGPRADSVGIDASPGSTPGTSRPPPVGPAATLTGPLAGGKGIALAAANSGPALDAAGYVEAEYGAAGTATSYTAVGDLPTDGTYRLQPGPEAEYATRIVVRRPKDPGAFNGTVAIEWLNVSGGADAGPDYTYLAPELLRRGYAWVGVSAQRIGIEGGTVAVQAPGAEAMGAGKGLRAFDPARYGQLKHPGDAFSYDMYTQVAQALRGHGPIDPLAGLDVQRVLAIGESQSAFTLTTYYNGVQPLTRQFDGFFVHSRGGAAAPLGTAGGGIDIAGSITGRPTTLRTDQPTPAIVVQTETDVLGVLGYYAARQPDAEHLRIWEVAGTAHADRYQIGELEPQMGCATPINRGQQVFVLRAALRHLQRWVTDGTPPPSAPVLEVDASGAQRAFVLDDLGNVKGGVRTPVVDAPVDVLSGLSPGTPTVLCLLLGTTTPLPAARLAALYPSSDAYLERYTEAADATIRAGFALDDDREALLDDADPARITG